MTELTEVKALRQKQKDDVYPPARHVRPLRTPADVTMEQKRIYRLALNGKIATDELTRLTYALKEIRAGLEADQPPVIDHVEGLHVTTVNVIGVPHGTFLEQPEIDRLNAQFAEVPPAHISGRSLPMLRVFENEEPESESESSPPAA